MTEKSYQVEVQPDFIERQAKAKPVQALAEFIWNGLDADATKVDAIIESADMVGMSKIIIRDNGVGIPYAEAPNLFARLGGSWKKPGNLTKLKKRMLHGYEGQGRFKAFALGRVADWNVTYKNGDTFRNYTISILEDNIKQVRISDEREVEASNTGVEVTISELHKDFRSLESKNGIQQFTEIFALYLEDYRDISIIVFGYKIDPAAVIASTKTVELSDIDVEGKPHSAQLEIIEWQRVTSRALYLCTEQGFPLSQVSTRFHIGDFQFSAYLKSTYVTHLHREAQLDLAEMNPNLVTVIEEAQQHVRNYFRDRAAEGARSIVEKWKEEQVYPYKDEAKSPIEEVERKFFDIVAVTTSNYMPDFQSLSPKNKAMYLRMLRTAIERSPEDLKIIMNEVLGLPRRKQEELAKLLREASLSSIISAAKIVADRLKFLAALELILYDPDMSKRLKERSQLHRILAIIHGFLVKSSTFQWTTNP